MRSAIVERPIDTAALVAEVASVTNGATLLFLGTVRETNDGRDVSGMDYTAYRGMAERELADIVGEASSRFETSDVVVEHRLGTLGLGEASVAIAVGHPHRGKAYDASRYIIEELKKLEHYVDGTREWVAADGSKRAPHGEAAVVNGATRVEP
jgi:molybdopterin synthase catalytic subunit